MFAKLLQSLFKRGKPAESGEQFVVRLAGACSADRLTSAKMLCIFDQGRIVTCHTDSTPAQRKAGEEWWLLPREDVTLRLPVPLEGATAETSLTIRFEPESELFALLQGRESVSEEDVKSLLTSQLAGLLELLGYQYPSTLLELGDLDRERLRAKTSLLLQNRGMRCTQLGAFKLAAVPAEEADAQDASKETASDKPNQTPATSTSAGAIPEETPAVPEESALAKLVSSVSTADEWDCLMAEMEETGYHFNLREAGELYDLGRSVLDRETRAEQAAAKMHQIALAARKRAGTISAEQRRMRGLDLRLESIREETVDQGTQVAPLAAKDDREPLFRRRPRTWWIFNQAKIDQRLGGWILAAVTTMRSSLDAYRSSVKVASALVPLRRIDERLQLAIDLATTVPMLAPSQSKLQLSKERIRELVRSVEVAVTATETSLAEIKELPRLAPASESWLAKCDSVCHALDQLANQLRQRRAVR